MKKRKIIISFLVIVAVLIVGHITARYLFSDYNDVLKDNWNLSLSKKSGYSEVYSKGTEPSFLGDGWRYHVFDCKEKEPINEMFAWQKKEKKTHFSESYSEAVSEWLDKIGVPTEQRPNYLQCVYWYQMKEDSSEIIILWDEAQSRIYLVESIM